MPGSLNVKVKVAPGLRPRLFHRPTGPTLDVDVCDTESRFTQVILVPALTTRSWWVKFTMSDKTPPASTASRVGVAAGVGVAEGVGVESELHAAIAAAVATNAVRSTTLLRPAGQARNSNGLRDHARGIGVEIGVATAPAGAQGFG